MAQAAAMIMDAGPGGRESRPSRSPGRLAQKQIEIGEPLAMDRGSHIAALVAKGKLVKRDWPMYSQA